MGVSLCLPHQTFQGLIIASIRAHSDVILIFVPSLILYMVLTLHCSCLGYLLREPIIKRIKWSNKLSLFYLFFLFTAVNWTGLITVLDNQLTVL